MAIKRNLGTTNQLNIDGTSIPDSDFCRETTAQTGDIYKINEEYKKDAQTPKDSGVFNTGALIPNDMTVKLVRADSANWETFVSVLYSVTLTLFGLFLGAWVTSPNTGKANTDFSSLEVTATLAFGGLSFVLILIWGYLKIKQQKEGVVISTEMLRNLIRD